MALLIADRTCLAEVSTTSLSWKNQLFSGYHIFKTGLAQTIIKFLFQELVDYFPWCFSMKSIWVFIVAWY